MKKVLLALIMLAGISLLFAFLVIGMIGGARQKAANTTPLPFQSDLWKEKSGMDYPHREALLEAVLYTDTIRGCSAPDVLHLLGDPDREEADHLYYRISQERVSLWPIYTRTIVIKLDGDSVDWIRLHE